MTNPHWTEEEQGRFLARTDTEYLRVPRSLVEARVGKDPLLEQLAEHLPAAAFPAGGYPASWLAGDTQRPPDVDLFFLNADAFDVTRKLLEEPPEEATLLRGYQVKSFEDLDSARFLTYEAEGKTAIQLVKLAWYEDPEHVVDTFDFTAAQVAVAGDEVVVNPMTLFDVARKRLQLHGLRFPGGTLRRLVKYTSQKGYVACPGFLSQLAAACQQVLNEDPSRNEPRHMYLD